MVVHFKDARLTALFDLLLATPPKTRGGAPQDSYWAGYERGNKRDVHRGVAGSFQRAAWEAGREARRREKKV